MGTLYELSQQYENSIAVQRDIIKKNRERLLTARRKSNFKEIQRLNKLLKTLYEEKWELEEKALALRKHLSS